MNLQKTSEEALLILHAIQNTVMSVQTKTEIEQRLIELAQQAFLLRANGNEGDFGRVSANALETHRLQCKLNAMDFYARSGRAVVHH